MAASRSLLFFDLDDTLVDHRAAEDAAQREVHAERAADFEGVPYDAWLAAYREANARLWSAMARGEIGPDELRRRRFAEPLAVLGLDGTRADALSGFYLEAYARAWTLVEGAEEILEFAAREGVCGVLSNGIAAIQRRKVERFRLDRFVSHVVLSEDVGAMKPARAIFDAAHRSAGSPSGRKVYVGDQFETDVVGAKAAGWFPILFDPDGAGAPRPTVYVRRLADLKPLLAG